MIKNALFAPTFTFILGIFLTSQTVSAQIVINEYSASNTATITDNYGEYEDWVEVYNMGAAAFDLSGYYLSDNPNNLTKWPIPAGASVPANGYLIIYFSGRGEFAMGNLHAGIKLTQTKPEGIIIADGGGSVVDQMQMIPAQENHSRGRTTDGDVNWSLFTTPTPGAPNAGAQQEYTPIPAFSVASGAHPGAVDVVLSTTDPNATIHYTLDGTVPTTGSAVYGGSINIPNTQVLRARAFSSVPDVPPSFVETNTYLINEGHTLPVIAISGDQVDDLLNGNGALRPQGQLEYFDANGVLADEALGEFNEHGNDSWAYDQRGFDYIVRDQYGYNYGILHQIFRDKDRDEFQRLIVKAAANDNISFEDGAHIRDAFVHSLSHHADLRIDERTNEFCILYLNGQYWGVYDVREKVDDMDFLEYYYDQDDVDFLKTWGWTWAEYGDDTDWLNLFNYIMTNDMSVQANYQQAKSRYNTGSLIDYVILNSYTVCADWLNWNTAWWRGKNPNGTKKKYRYALWDMDATFGHYINYTGIPNTGANADPCDPEGLDAFSDPEGHIQLLNKLMDNDEFQQDYISRYIDLSNSYFSCDYMHQHLDSMIAHIQPEMQRQVTRWGGSMAQWNANVATLKQFIDDRCAAITTGMVGCYTLTGPHNIQLDVQPAGAGTIFMNSMNVNNFTWSGIYYGGVNLELTAIENAGYVFDYWDAQVATINPVIDSLAITADVQAPDIFTAYFREEGDTTTPAVSVTAELLITVPNAFTPNGDGWNDVLYPIGSRDIAIMEMMIFDRWGKLLFKTDNLATGWDGTYEGTPVNSGVYTYTLKATFNNGARQTKGGNVTLMR